jgi:branched-chain amino acid transport system permease protein
VILLAVPVQALLGQLLIGLINGSFYALLSLGLAIIFGLLNVINFSHGALYMLGAFVAYFLLDKAGIGYWGALFLAPLAVGIFGAILERLFLRRIATLECRVNCRAARRCPSCSCPTTASG